jgi:hypothetical protein
MTGVRLASYGRTLSEIAGRIFNEWLDKIEF